MNDVRVSHISWLCCEFIFISLLAVACVIYSAEWMPSDFQVCWLCGLWSVTDCIHSTWFGKASPCLWRFARHGLWCSWKWLNRDHMWRGRVKSYHHSVHQQLVLVYTVWCFSLKFLNVWFRCESHLRYCVGLMDSVMTFCCNNCWWCWLLMWNLVWWMLLICCSDIMQ